MINLIYIVCIAVIQQSSAQLTYTPRNAISANIQPNQMKNVANNLNPLVANTQGLHLTRNGQSVPNLHLSNFHVNGHYNPMINANNKFNPPQSNLNVDLTNGRLNKAQISSGNAELNTKLAQLAMAEANKNAATNQIINTNLANVETSVLANARIGNNWANNEARLGEFETANVPTNLVSNTPNMWALNNLASLNGNTATFNIGNGGQVLTITSGSPNSPPFGLQLLAEALEVGGTVSVNGRMPIYGTVSLNGNVPTDGSASVKYNSARQNVPTSQI